MIEFITIQEISAKHPCLHDFLKKWNLNTHKNIFFMAHECVDHNTIVEYDVMILRSDGTLFLAKEGSEGYNLVPLNDSMLIQKAIEQARRAVNLKHYYLSDTLECIEKSLNLRPSNALF